MPRNAVIAQAVLWIAAGWTIAQPADAAPAGGKAAIAVVAESGSDATRLPGPFTFGMIFARGDMPDSVAVEGLPTQADVKRRWPDGSIKHAVLTVDLPELPAGCSR